jgi:hypothetical protein
MAENIEKAAAGQTARSTGNGTNSLVTGWWAGQLFGGDRGRGRGRSGSGEPSRAHWENMDAYANREHERRLDYLRNSHDLSPEGTFASGVEYGDRGTKNAYTQRRAEPVAKAEAKPAATRSRQTAKTPPKPSTGSKSRGAEVGAAIGGTIGTALGAAAVKNPAGAAVGGEIGAKAGEAIGSAVSNTVAKSKAKKAAAASGSAAGSSYTTDIKFGTSK